MSARNFTDAQSQLASALTKNADDVPTLLLKGEADLAASDFETALKSFERASDGEPEALRARFGKLRALLGLQRFEDAMKLANELHAQAPESPMANYLRGIAAQGTGN